MRKALLVLAVMFSASSVCGAHVSPGPSASPQIAIVTDSTGSRLTIDGKPVFLCGMNWDYFPIGTNYEYSLWSQPDKVIEAALQNEMPLLRDMGVNVIRQYNTVPPRWIQYIYEHYGIYTMINHAFGRYGMIVGGVDYSNTDYCREDTREALLREARLLANTYKDTPGLLLYLLGNENNYGLFWGGAETEDIPVADRHSTREARCLYKLFNEAVLSVKAIDTQHPVAICNGDLLFLDILAEECPDVDVLGLNSYRGPSFDRLFEDVKEKYGKPLLLTEFGADAFNAVTKRQAQREQADILLSNWFEIYANAAGQANCGNCIGGFTFQFSDGWWKSGQTKNLDVHDTTASWTNGGYQFDYAYGQNNMNEEWFGICAKGQPDQNGLYPLYPRTAYYVLGQVHGIDPYQVSPTSLQQHFDAVKTHVKQP